MERHERTGQRLVALGLLGAVAFNYPVLGLFNKPATLLGIPLLYAYIFAVWALLVVAMALVVERGRPR